MALPENLPLEDRWRRALAEIPIRDRAWFFDCEPNLNEGRLLLRFKTTLHARSASERIGLLIPLVGAWIPAAQEIEVMLADKSLLVQPLPRAKARPVTPSRPPSVPPSVRNAPIEPSPPPVAPIRATWRPDLDPTVKVVLTKFGGSIVAVSRSNDSPDLPGDI
jgi:hypothetical protein